MASLAFVCSTGIYFRSHGVPCNVRRDVGATSFLYRSRSVSYRLNRARLVVAPLPSPRRDPGQILSMLGGGGRGSRVPNQERVLSMLPYVVPLLDSLSFGLYFFKRVPLAGSLILGPLYPLYQVYRGIPFLAFGVFLALYLLVVRNVNVPGFIRFNTYQALILDIVLIFPQLLSGVNFGSAIPASIIEVLSTSVFYGMALAIGYSVVSNAKGELPDQIPGISDSVRSQIGPL